MAQLWVLRAVTQAHAEPWERLRNIAKQQKRDVKDLYREAKVPQKDLAK